MFATTGLAVDEGRRVTIEVIGAYRDADVRYLAETVAAMFPDKLDHRSWSASGNRFTYQASPVDADAVAKKIKCGKVTKLDENTIRVIFDYDTDIPARFHKGTASFIPHPRDQLGGTLKRFKGNWWSALDAMRIEAKWTKQRKLIGLEMPRYKTTDETLLHLAELSSLQELDLSMNRHVSDEGARHLASLINLELLDLFGTHIANQGQAHLKNLMKLKKLKLSGRGTENGLRHLAGLTGLQQLSIGYGLGYPVTPAGLQHLKKHARFAAAAAERNAINKSDEKPFSTIGKSRKAKRAFRLMSVACLLLGVHPGCDTTRHWRLFDPPQACR